jgi:SAM-dependent methyltransferase
MSVEEFFDLFITELKENKTLWSYYKFLETPKPSVYNFRKNYFLQRLNYINNQIDTPNSKIWDCGCGYGTTAIYLALNGHEVYGNTLEFYYEQIGQRQKYWSRFGNLDKLKLTYADIFETIPVPKYEYIIAQDTLHHLEPIDKAIDIISKSMVPGSKIIAIEVNGNNIIERFRYFLQRGNKKIIELYDEKLTKTILLGNENVRPINTWQKLLINKNLLINHDSIEYIRLFPPVFYRIYEAGEVMKREKHIWKRNGLLKNYFYFGVNFTASMEQ